MTIQPTNPIHDYREALYLENSNRSQALVLLHQAASNNYAPALYRLGAFYLFGNNKNIEQGISFYRQAAHLNHPAAAYDLAIWYEQNGNGDAIHWYKEATKTNQKALAHFRLGKISHFGLLGAEKNIFEAINHYKQARKSDSRHGESAFCLGLLAKESNEVNSAFNWFYIAAYNGYPLAFDAYIDLIKDFETNDTAIKHLETLYNSPHANELIKQKIAIKLGTIFFNKNEGSPSSHWNKAQEWYQKASESNLLDDDTELKKIVFTNLGKIFFYNNEHDEAEASLLIAANLNDVEAMIQLGVVYLDTPSDDEDPEMPTVKKQAAFDIWAKAKELNSADAEDFLQKYFANGRPNNFSSN